MKAKTLNQPPPATRRILLVDDHPVMREGIARWIEREPGLEVCGEASNAAEGLQAVERLEPDLVVTDISLNSRSGLELIKDIRVLKPSLPVLVLSMHDEEVYAERAMRAGAQGYIMKEAGGESLLQAVRQVLAGQVYFSSKVAARLLAVMTGGKEGDSNSPFGKLTDREFEIFHLVGNGKSTREIARQLSISPKTVDAHRGNIKKKLGLASANELFRHAVRWVES